MLSELPMTPETALDAIRDIWILDATDRLTPEEFRARIAEVLEATGREVIEG